jgi:mannosyl-3-phosphoglycerate phosphatase
MPSTRRPDLVVFSDLDGTLLSHHEYDWAPAAPAIDALRHRAIPLILTSSKTRREIEAWRARLDNTEPFISENGGALWLPAGWLDHAPADAEPVGDLWRISFGISYPAVRRVLPVIAGRLGVPLRGFGDMAAAEVAERTGLSGRDLVDVMAREYDEPFVPARPLSPEEEATLEALAADAGLSITTGGRFLHLLGGCSKGAAARRLLELLGQPRAVAVGDARNDLDLLQALDEAIVVARPDGSHDPILVAALPRARFTRGIGPAGFSEGVLAAIESNVKSEE